MMLSGAWALWRLCVSDFYQGKPIRPDRGMMILGHHHSGDTAPTQPRYTLIHQTAQNTQPRSLLSSLPLTLSPTYVPLSLLPFFFCPLSQTFSCSCTLALILFLPLALYFHCFISFSLSYSLSPLSPPRSLFLALSLMAKTKTNSALFLAHETFNISFQILADASKK